MATVRAISHSVIDQNGKRLEAWPITGSTKLAFDGDSKNVQLPVNTGTSRTGWVLSFTATQDCWIKFGTAAPTAAPGTDDNIFLKTGVVLGPIFMNDYTYVGAIRDDVSATNGTLCILEHTYTA